MASRSRARVLTHAFLIAFTAAVLFPVAKVIQMALSDRQTFDTSLVPIPSELSLANFGYVIGRTKIEGLGPELSTPEVKEFAGNLAGLEDAAASEAAPALSADQARRLEEKRCLTCHTLGVLGREGLGGDLTAAGRLGSEALARWLGDPSRENAVLLGIRANPTGAMQRHTLWLFGRQLLNSAVVSVLTALLGIFLSCSAAYAFSRFRFPGRKAGLMGFLVIQMFPGTMMMIPLYILIEKLGLLDHLLGLVLVYATTAIPFCIWMLKGYFDTIPRELEEAALIDGASRLRIFWTLILPLAKPAIAVTGLFSFMTAWNEFILAATFMNDETSQTLPVMLNGFVSSTTVEWGHFAAGAVIVSLPVVVLFFLLQKHLVGGLTAGAVKG